MSAIPTFYARCSALGTIMTNDPSGKKPGKTCTTYLNTWMVEKMVGYQKEVRSKYMDKGNQCEPDSINRLGIKLKMHLEKNEFNLRNEFLTGTPDIIGDGFVADVKTAWDAFTMPYFEPSPAKDYWWQLQGYMMLTKTSTAYLAHCLENAPDDPAPNSLVSRAARTLMYERGLDEIDMDLWQEVLGRMTFDHLKDAQRIKVFKVEAEDVAAKVQERVEWCREYIKGAWVFIEK